MPAVSPVIGASAATDDHGDAARWPAIGVTGAEPGPLDRAAIAQALTETGAFAAVSVGPVDSGYQLSVDGELIHDSHCGLVGASIGARLLWRGQYLDSFSYRLPVQAPGGGHKRRERESPSPGLSSTLASRLVRDFQARRAFTAQTLHAALQASDYFSALRLPETIDVWQRQAVQIFRDPLLGAHARYRRADRNAGHVDVFVYPIRSRSWDSPGPLLAAELQSAGEDLVRLQDRGLLRALRIGPVVEPPRSSAMDPPSRQISGEFADPGYQPFDLHGYVLIREDKFVKVLATIARHEAASTDIAGFVSVLAGTIDVPPESRFMARVRRAWSGSVLPPGQASSLSRRSSPPCRPFRCRPPAHAPAPLPESAAPTRSPAQWPPTRTTAIADPAAHP